ncbi:MAG: diguanylate cyclase [Steroidobacteraceae bacterium]
MGIGLYRWHGYDNVESWTKDQGLDPESVWNIARDRQHRLILGTDLGCRMLDEIQHRVVPCPTRGFPDQETNASAVGPIRRLLVVVSERAAVAGGSGCNPGRARDHGGPINSMPQRCCLIARAPGWIAAWDYGVAKIDSRTLAVTRLALPGNPRVDDVTQGADGTIWVGATNGLYRIAGDRFVKIQTAVDGQQIGIQTVAASKDGSLWGTRTGEKILHLTAPPHSVPQWQDPETMSGATVYSLRADSRGWIWANTGEGLGVYDGHVWRRIEIGDGLIWADTEQFALYSDDDGSIWVGTGRGRHPYQGSRALGCDDLAPLKLEIVKAYLGTQSLLASLQPAVKWRDNSALDVSFGSHSFDRSPATELRYRLLGLSSEWYSSRTFAIHIPALAPAHYKLEAMSVDTPHARESPVVSLTFDVNPPWWQTKVFRWFAALLMAALLVAFWRWQNLRMQRRQRTLETAHREREALLERAMRDALTGLWNRATILEFLTGEMDQARKQGGALAVAIIDVDFFKRINDSLGHAGGDQVLKELARRLRAQLRQRDSLGRYGGEELLVVMPGLGREDRGTLMNTLRENISAGSFRVREGEVNVTVSIGVAWMDSTHDEPDDLILRADAALYEAKAAGRNRVICSTGNNDGSLHETTGSRRYLQEFIDRVKREAGKRGVETESK